MKIKLTLIASVCPQPVMYGDHSGMLLPLLLVCTGGRGIRVSTGNIGYEPLTRYPTSKKGERNSGEFSTQPVSWATVLLAILPRADNRLADMRWEQTMVQDSKWQQLQQIILGL